MVTILLNYSSAYPDGKALLNGETLETFEMAGIVSNKFLA